MPGASAEIPEGYEILKTIETSASVCEYVARRKLDNALVRLRIFNFSKTTGATTRRHLREYLRCDITFMEELDVAGVIRIVDYSDTKDLFWTATEPAEVDKLSKSFDFLASQSLEFRRQLVRQFLATLQRLHNSHVVHRNLSADAVFLSPEPAIYIGEFGFASYLTGQTTASGDTTAVATIAYQPPEVRHAGTFSCDVSCDIFSAGLLVYEILSARPLAKDDPAQIHEVLRVSLYEQLAAETIDADTVEAILKAADPSPEKRWPSVQDFANAFEAPGPAQPSFRSMTVGPTPTIGVTKPIEPTKTMPLPPDADAVQKPPAGPPTRPAQPADGITPLDPAHEIWNNQYEIIEKIGEGGQAVVYEAYDHLTNEEIAIKTIWSRHRQDRAAINRLKQGAMIARSLTHRYIIKTYSVEQRIDAEGPGRYVFICMELIKSRLELGDVIEARRAAGKKVRLDETLHIIRQLLDALAYAHEYTIHRDIKPGNIMLVARGEETDLDSPDLTKFDIRLIDFGIAKVLSQKHIDVTGKGFRSAHYGAPELADSKTGVDARADVYSAGIIMYQMLTLNIPRKGSPPANKVNRDVPAALAKVIDRAINAQRQKRFKSASEFAKEIDKAVSKFNWLRKAAKVAAVLLIGLCAAAVVKYFLPEPDYGSVPQSIEILEERIADKRITTFADNALVTHSDIEGYDAYESLRKTALENLKIVRMAGNDKFNKRTFSPWRQQQDIWLEIEPAVRKVEHISQDQRAYNARKNLAVADYLTKLSPSSKIVSTVKEQTKKAEVLLDARPLSQNTLDFCMNSYDLGARVFANIETLSGGADTPQTAEEINDKLKGVEKLRDSFLFTRSSLEAIEQLKDPGFHERSDRCFERADGYYQSFELQSARKYFSLLGQICGTITYVRDQIDFGRSDIALVSSRLMDLCYEDIETFENYPTWKQRLEAVYRKKDVLARYTLIQTLLSEGPKDAPLTIYDSTASAIRHYEQGDMDSAGAQLTDAAGKYKKFIRRKIDGLVGDCDSLSTFPSVSVEGIENCRVALQQLSGSIDEPAWPQADFIDRYNRCHEQMTSEKDAVRQRLIRQAKQLRETIVKSANKAQQQDFFFKSRLIDRYIAVGRHYDRDDIDTSITNWKYVEDLPRLSTIVDRMTDIDSRLAAMLTRKDQLERLSKDIDRAVGFCDKFKGISAREREKYRQLGQDLKQLRTKLTASQNNTYLIDQSEEIFTTEHNKIQSGYSEIRALLPYHRSRVIELINKSHKLEKDAGYITQLRQHWNYLLADSDISQLSPDFTAMRTYLNSVKEDVDNWSPESFNRRMQDRCRSLTRAFEQQQELVTVIISRILDEKSELTGAVESLEKNVNKVLNDPDVRELGEIAANDNREALLGFRQLPNLLSTRKRRFDRIVLDSASSTESISSQISADFEVDTWLENFNAAGDSLDTRISQFQAIEDMSSLFQQTRQILARQSSMETDYYLALRDCSVNLIDYSDAADKIASIEADSAVAKMCNFLEQMDVDGVPRLNDLKASVTGITNQLTGLKSTQVAALSQIKSFNTNRHHLLGRIAAFRQDVAKLDRPNLEDSCKQTVSAAVNRIANLLNTPNQTGTLRKLSSLLWTIFPDHRHWSQWRPFLKLHHIAVSGEDISLGSSDVLKPVNKSGGYLNPAQIAANPTESFYTDTGGSANFGWPCYICHQKDPTVILAFIPAAEPHNTQPFYMALREITNAQYKLFMAQTGAKTTTKLTGWSYFADKNNNLLIGQAQGQFPPSAITWDNSANLFVVDEEFRHAPITWVTSYGARAYARWLNAQLPTVSQHAYASRADSAASYPWGPHLSDAASYAHVRSAVWQNAAREYNVKRDNPVEIAYPPVGAVKDFLREKALDPDRIVHPGTDNYPVWPCFTNNSKPNTWGLYDMIGNVWEWCIDSADDSSTVICGGSCLSPAEYISPQSKYHFDAQTCDVGFRIVIPAR